MKGTRVSLSQLFVMMSLLLLTSCSATVSQPTSNGRPGSGQPSPAPGITRRIASHNHPSTQAERDQTPLTPDPQRVLYFVRPHDTDTAIDHFLQDHYVMYNRAVAQNGKLFVFFPGTFGRPQDYQLLLNEAAHQGYRAIGLEYPNDTGDPADSTVEQICRSDPDPSCADHVREERLSGDDPRSPIAVTPANAIENRLFKLLVYLQRQHPDEHWDSYLHSGQISWSQIAVGGHSQGSGFAALIAKRHVVARVALWSGPNDHTSLTHQPATWMTNPSATPLSRYYGMLHQHEHESAGAGPLTGWHLLGLSQFGPPIVATSTAPPYGHSHELLVTMPTHNGATTPNAYHRSTATDDATPRDTDQRPAYRTEWDYLIG